MVFCDTNGHMECRVLTAEKTSLSMWVSSLSEFEFDGLIGMRICQLDFGGNSPDAVGSTLGRTPSKVELLIDGVTVRDLTVRHPSAIHADTYDGEMVDGEAIVNTFQIKDENEINIQARGRFRHLTIEDARGRQHSIRLTALDWLMKRQPVVVFVSLLLWGLTTLSAILGSLQRPVPRPQQ